jgi:hypothetical protein
MAKTLLYKLFGLGRMPANHRAAAESEGLVLADEGIRGTVTYRNFRGGGRYANWKRQWYTASIALTARRLIACRHSHSIIDVTLDDPRIKQMNFTVEEPDVFLAAFDAGLFQKDWTGTIEYRFKTPIAQNLLNELHIWIR